MRARARVMGETDEVQERIKADLEAMKEQMATMMEAMMSMGRRGKLDENREREASTVEVEEQDASLGGLIIAYL